VSAADEQPAIGSLRGRVASLEPWQRNIVAGVGAVALLGLVAVTVATVAYWSIYATASIPAPDELARPDPTVVIDQHDDEVATLEPAEMRRNIDLDDLPDHVPDAILAAEDRRFHEHGGFSVRGIARAAWANVTAGEIRQGASTIHQQYVAMAIADIGEGYISKFREAAIASRLDSDVDKDTVLEMYLNSVPFGRTAEGIEAAARTYFDVGADELDVEQAALLAGMIAAPTAFDPATNPDAAAHRRDFVLRGMEQMGTLDADAAEELAGSELPALRDEPLVSFDEHSFFLEAVRNQVPTLLDDDTLDPSTGLVIHTTLDPRAQQLADAELNAQLADLPYDGAAVTIESDGGQVRALVGGLDFEEEQHNVALSGDRQPGSAFKTFALAELVRQGYDPETTRIEAPLEYDVQVEGGEDATVGNYSGLDHGEVSAHGATVESINTAYIQLAEELGTDRIAELAADMGIESELHEFPSLVLGTAEVLPLELTVAYATLAAEGTRHTPHMVELIESHDGEVLYEHEPDADEVLDPNEANVVTDVLVDVVESGTGIAANLPRPNAGKTGTTNDFRDAWFVGYTPQHATTVWVGHADNSPMEGEIAGSSLPAQIWGEYMRALVEDLDVEEFTPGDTTGLVPLTGLEQPEPEPEPEPRDDEAREEDDEDDDEEDEDDEDEDDEDEEDEDDEDEEDEEEEEEEEEDEDGEGEDGDEEDEDED
jgi:penicillin-binding protein 1A